MRTRSKSSGVSFCLLIGAATAAFVGCSSEQPAPSGASGPVVANVTRPSARKPFLGMSPMGHLAHRAQLATARAVAAGQKVPSPASIFAATTSPAKGGDDCGSFCEDDEGYQEGPAGGQAETSIATDSTGQHVVVGYNDTRGFYTPTTSLSGFAYSDDGGKTFTDGGQLPTPGDFVLNGARFPQVFGDPDIKYVGACTFVYSSILVTKFNDKATVQTLGLHRSTDCGHTWEGPFEIPAASNPTGQTTTSSTGVVRPVDAADKEYIDVDPDTGRVIVGWSTFTTGGEQLSVAYSDDAGGTGTPTWSKQIVVGGALGEFDQSAIARFAGNGSGNAYAAWSIRVVDTDPTGYQVAVGFARSTDNGTTWQPPIVASAPFFGMDQVLGNDRVHNFPALAVDNSHGKNRGTVYLAYADNDSHDGSDIVLQKSTDGGVTFTAPLALNSRPGADRAQWFPWISVDRDTGRVNVIYYDQGVATSGDLTEVSLTFSDDGGTSWSKPRPISHRPFKAGWGNDTGQPNIGDYVQSVSQGGEVFAEFGSTAPTGFADGQPNLVFPSFTTPDAVFARAQRRGFDVPTGGIQLGNVTFTETNHGASLPNGNLDPGDVVRFKFPIINSVTNPLNARAEHDLVGILTSKTPGVSAFSLAEYEDVAPGQTRTSEDDFRVRLDSSFVPGTPIEFVLDVRREFQLVGRLYFTQQTGTPVKTVLFAENFDAPTDGKLPAGWTSLHIGGLNVVPWITTSSFCGATSNGAFHTNANDQAIDPTRFERLLSPPVTVPAGAQYVTLDFDVCYDTEDDPNLNIQAFDGLVLRFSDITGNGRFPNRAVLAEAFETDFTTGDFLHYPKHFPRNGSSRYFQDMSAWAGDSQGMKHVHLRLPGMEGSTVQLRYEFTQDFAGICSDVRPGHTCGVFVDNIVMQAVSSTVPPHRRGGGDERHAD